VLGVGAVTVVLSEQSDGLLCSWLPLARTFIGTAPPGRVQLVTVPGSDHGTALLAGPGSAAVLTRIDAFLGQLG
jgi:hypothetical protein